MKKVKKWFTWHLWPEPKPVLIQSVYEIAFLMIIFVGCLFLYVRINRVNMMKSHIKVACIDKTEDYGNGIDTIAPYVTIRYSFPMTALAAEEMDGLSMGNFVVFDFGKQANSLNNVLNEKDTAWINRCKISNSIMPLNNYPDKVKRPSFYIQHHTKLRNNALYNHVNTKNFSDTIHPKSASNLTWYKYSYTSKQGETVINESFISGFGGIKTPIITITNEDGLGFGNPGWFSLEDISQMYYDIKLSNYNVDSISLYVDFVGVADFSEMVPKPDTVKMNSIVFTNQASIRQIQENGLRFHVKFKELENRQNVRLFFLTSIMGALITILIVFIILAFYKLFRTKSKQ